MLVGNIIPSHLNNKSPFKISINYPLSELILEWSHKPSSLCHIPLATVIKATQSAFASLSIGSLRLLEFPRPSVSQVKVNRYFAVENNGDYAWYYERLCKRSVRHFFLPENDRLCLTLIFKHIWSFPATCMDSQNNVPTTGQTVNSVKTDYKAAALF